MNPILFFSFWIFLDSPKEIIKDNQNKESIIKLKAEFISQIYTLLKNKIKEKIQKKITRRNLCRKKILITIIKSEQRIKEYIIYTKINNETLFDIIYNKLIQENKKEVIMI